MDAVAAKISAEAVWFCERPVSLQLDRLK